MIPSCPICISGTMDKSEVMSAFGALSQTTRFSAFELLVKHAPEGLTAGKLAEMLGVPQNTLSSHLVVLERDAGLVAGDRRGRTIVYRARTGRLGEILTFFTQQCCQGRMDQCGLETRPGSEP